MYRSWVLTTACLTLWAALAPAQDTASQPTARELFYQPASPPPKTAQPPKPSSTPKRTPSAPVSPGTDAASTPPTVRTTPGGAPQGTGSTPPHAMNASAVTGPPLGLRYSILRLVGGKPVEVSPNFVFHAGDHFQLRVETNAPGYLYVVNQGSSGAWEPMFPSPKIANGDNHVDGFHPYILPTPEYQMSFDERTGTENVTIVFSRQPVQDFESLIYSLQGKPGQPSSPQPAGESAPRPLPKGSILSARAEIGSGVLDALRGAVSRDLIVEPVDSNTPADSSKADQKETAVYVVNPSGSADSRLLADLHLVHR